MPKGFTLVELIITVIIVGILAAFAMPQFAVTKERTLDKDAQANLKLIQAGEKIYRMENAFYYPNSGTAATSDINTNLRLAIPEGASHSWSYSSDATNPGQAVATRNKTGGRFWTLPVANDLPTCANGGSDNCL